MSASESAAVIDAADGVEGIRKAISEHPDLVLVDIAPYIGDARALKLALIGEWSEEAAEFRAYRHDWHNILGAIGALGYDHALARLSKFSGALLMLLSWIWGALLLRRQYARLSGDVFDEQ